MKHQRKKGEGVFMTNEEIIRESFKLMAERKNEGNDVCIEIGCNSCPFEDWYRCPNEIIEEAEEY